MSTKKKRLDDTLVLMDKMMEQMPEFNDIKDMDDIHKQTDEEILEEFGYDLVERARNNKVDKVIGREKEINDLIGILCKVKKNNPIILGESGVGKTAIVEGLAIKIANNDVPIILKKKIYVLDYPQIVSHSIYKGQFEKTVKKIINVLNKQSDCIVFIDEIHTIMSPVKLDNSVDLGNLLKPIITSSNLAFIGATTLNEYKKYIVTDKAFSRRFVPLLIKEPSIEDTLKILEGLRSNLEATHSISISNSILEKTVELSTQHLTNRYRPDKSIDLIEVAASNLDIDLYNIPKELEQTREKLFNLSYKLLSLNKNSNEYEKIQTQVENLKLEIESIEISIERKHRINEKFKKQINKINVIKRNMEEAKKNLDINKYFHLEHIDLHDANIEIENIKDDLELISSSRILTEKDIRKALNTIANKDIIDETNVMEKANIWKTQLIKLFPYLEIQIVELITYFTNLILQYNKNIKSNKDCIAIVGNASFSEKLEFCSAVSQVIFNKPLLLNIEDKLSLDESLPEDQNEIVPIFTRIWQDEDAEGDSVSNQLFFISKYIKRPIIFACLTGLVDKTGFDISEERNFLNNHFKKVRFASSILCITTVPKEYKVNKVLKRVEDSIGNLCKQMNVELNIRHAIPYYVEKIEDTEALSTYLIRKIIKFLLDTGPFQEKVLLEINCTLNTIKVSTIINYLS